MKRSKRKPSADLGDIDFAEAMERFIATSPSELEQMLETSLAAKQAKANERIDSIRKEIEDGGRPKEGRFRL